MKIRLTVLGLIICATAIGYFAFNWWSVRNAPTRPIASSGGRNLSIVLAAPAHYLQADPRWADHAIGGSGEKLRSVGCTICSAATALTAIGSVVTPAQLNQQLKDNNGYTSQGWVIWGKISITQSSAVVDVVHQATHEMLDASLESGDYPLVKFWLSENISHWVVLIGKEGQEYLALDPLSEGGPKKLSSLTESIYSVRVFRRR